MAYSGPWPDATPNFGKYAGGNWPGKSGGAWSPNTSSRMGQPGVGVLGFSVYADVRNIIKLIDQTTMKFRGGAFNRAIAGANLEAATAIQEGMANELDRRIDRQIGVRGFERRQRAGKRLRNSLLHYKNHEITTGGFTVGRPTWLDQSPATEYWRQIEYGNKPYRAYVLWTNDFNKFYEPYREGGGDRKSPPFGYPHLRMPLGAGASSMVGPFPAYHFSEGGRKVIRQIDWKVLYSDHLWRAGLTTQGVFRGQRVRPKVH